MIFESVRVKTLRFADYIKRRTIDKDADSLKEHRMEYRPVVCQSR